MGVGGGQAEAAVSIAAEDLMKVEEAKADLQKELEKAANRDGAAQSGSKDIEELEDKIRVLDQMLVV